MMGLYISLRSSLYFHWRCRVGEKMATQAFSPREFHSNIFFKWETLVLKLGKLVIIFVTGYLRTGR